VCVDSEVVCMCVTRLESEANAWWVDDFGGGRIVECTVIFVYVWKGN
jgi:hypothetical protein